MGHFSFTAALFGLLIVATGTGITLYHQKLADNLGSGVASYSRFKLAGLITIGVGFIIMTNLHTAILSWLVGLVFPR